VRILSISAVVTISLLIGLRYVWLLRKRKISPALATQRPGRDLAS
jgi:hypothetical protein